MQVHEFQKQLWYSSNSCFTINASNVVLNCSGFSISYDTNGTGGVGINITDQSNITIEAIQKIVANHYKLKVSELKSKSNTREIAFPRQVAMYLCKTLTRSSLPEIGREFGDKHHTTVMHSVKKIHTLYEEKKGNFHTVINSLIANCK